jgi:phospho-N-acetylmuramoyl-pentapeptide-transferase
MADGRIYQDMLFSVLISFAVTVAAGKIFIPMLRRLKVSQTERTDGPQSHLKKTGTATMGGVLFLAGILVSTLIFAHSYPGIIPLAVLTFGFGLIGFADDYIKVVLKRSMGLRAWQKLLLQFILTLVFLAALTMTQHGVDLSMKIPFMKGQYLDLGWGNIVILFIAVLGTVNGTNFTDGVDGLLSTVTLPVAAFFTAASLLTSGRIEPFTCAVMGGLMGFLVFNAYPARIFMGDTGSLALGGFVAAAAYSMKMPIFIIIVGFIYMLEVISVILQVGYFKLTHGKRLFRMAPIHHHFEKGGWSETKVVTVFSVITALLCMTAFMGAW